MAEQGSVWLSLIENELKFEHDRRNSINTRAATAVTGTAGFVTVLLAVITALRGKDYTLPLPGIVALSFALLALFSAALYGLVAGASRGYTPISARGMQAMLTPRFWTDCDEVDARAHAARIYIKELKTLREGNDKKVRHLHDAAVFQVIAIGLLIVTAILVN